MTEADGVPKQPTEDEMRTAYEAELNRITSTEMLLQTVVTLVGIGGRRLGLAGGTEGHRDLEQACDAIDGARALIPILERRMSAELGPLRDAIAQLQLAYAREIQGGGDGGPSARPAPTPESAGQAEKGDATVEGDRPRGTGPAESSGRLWVPGR